MKTNLFSYNSILFTLIIILISTITIWKLPQTQNGYTHIGIAVYDMDDTFINDYVTKLQNKIDRSSFSGKKVLYEIFDAEGNANRQEHQLQYMYTQNFDALLRAEQVDHPGEVDLVLQVQDDRPTHLTIVPGATHLFEEPGTLEAVARTAAEWLTHHPLVPKAPVSGTQ